MNLSAPLNGRLLLVGAWIGLALVGCGGSSTSSSSPSQPKQVQTTGGIKTASGSTTTAIASTGENQSVQVSVNGQLESGTLPAGESIPADGNALFVPSGVALISGMVPQAKLKATAPTFGLEYPGAIFVDGAYAGIYLTPEGFLSGNLILGPGYHTLTMYGPINIVSQSTVGNPSTPQELTVGYSISLDVVVNADGAGSIPTQIVMNLPSNGGTLGPSNYVQFTYPTPDFAAGTGQLEIIAPTVNLAGSATIANGTGKFDIAGQFPIPSNGIDSVTFQYLPSSSSSIAGHHPLR